MDLFIEQLKQTSLLEWAGTGSGLAAVYLSIKQKTLAWPLFILCYGIYVYLSFQASLTGAMVLNAVFIPIAIYGWWSWARNSSSPDKAESEDHKIKNMSWPVRFVTIGIVLGFSVVLSGINQKWIGGAMPHLDAFATAASLTAQWMLTRKYIENWIMWIIADLTFVVVWGMQGYWVTVAMFLIFTGLATSGLLQWQKETGDAR